MALRAVGTYYIENFEDNGIDVPTDTAGSITLPEFIYRATATYTADPWTIQVTGRGVSESTYDNAFVECTTACPVSTIANRTINNNKIDGAYYIDLAMTYDLKLLEKTEAFVSITNLFNRDPEIVAYGPAGTAYGNPSTAQGVFDILGRVFRVGVRFEY